MQFPTIGANTISNAGTFVTISAAKFWFGSQYTAISRKVVGENVDATIPKGINMGYDRYTVPDDCSCRTYFCFFTLALANIFPWPFMPIF